MTDGTKGRALVPYASEPPVGAVAPTGGPARLGNDAAAVSPRSRDRRRPGRLPDALVRGLLLDRLA